MARADGVKVTLICCDLPAASLPSQQNSMSCQTDEAGASGLTASRIADRGRVLEYLAALPEHVSKHVPLAAARFPARSRGSPGDAAGRVGRPCGTVARRIRRARGPVTPGGHIPVQGRDQDRLRSERPQARGEAAHRARRETRRARRRSDGRRRSRRYTSVSRPASRRR